MAGGHKDAVFAQRETGSAVRGVVVNHALARCRNGQPPGQPSCRSCIQSSRRPEEQRPFVATVNSTGVSQERLHPTGRVSGEAQSAVVATVHSTGVSPLIQRPTGLVPSGTQSADLI